MRIHDDHRNYGSALIQIAEDSHFTAINSFKYQGRISRCGFRVNKDIGVYIRYRTEAQGRNSPAFIFSFSQDNLTELKHMKKRVSHLFLALVCVGEREICCLPYPTFLRFVAARFAERGEAEAEYQIEVHIPAGQQMRVGINPPKRKRQFLEYVIVPRNNFPSEMFKAVMSNDSN